MKRLAGAGSLAVLGIALATVEAVRPQAASTILGKSAARCQKQIGKAGQVLAAGYTKAWQKCFDATLGGKTCNAGKRDGTIAAAMAKHAGAITKACGGAVAFGTPPDGVGFATTCDLEPGDPSGVAAACRALAVTDAQSLAACLACWQVADLNALVAADYPCLATDVPAGSDLDCPGAIPTCPLATDKPAVACLAKTGAAGSLLVVDEAKALAQCLDAVRKGKRTGPCPDATASGKIAQARTKRGKQIAKCAALPPWWNVCPIDPTPPCDRSVGSVGALHDCVTLGADTAALALVCQQYPNATADGLACSSTMPPVTTTSTTTTTSSPVVTTTVVTTTTTTTEPELEPSALDPGIATVIAAATAFLYTGNDPVQTGVALGTIDERRAAVVRGVVREAGGAPLPGVTVAIEGHPEFGQTLTRTDGAYDLAVNGGGLLTVGYAATGLLAAHRQVDVPWLDYVVVPDVILLAQDANANPIDLDLAEPIQVARGSDVTDADGTRRGTLLVPQGTQAALILPGGGTQPITDLTVRITEYTVGADGPAAMPAALPPTSSYTYAMELSADEAVAAGAVELRFDQPLAFHVENFLGLPVGTAVPAAFYDTVRSAWVPVDDGRVIKIVGTTASAADLDIDGDDVADDASGLGVTVAERERLAILYPVGQELWRVPVEHFTPYDLNYGSSPVAGSEPPDVPLAVLGEDILDDPCERAGSLVEAQSQVLGEAIGVAGTPLALHYRSDRVPGRVTARTIDVPLTDATVPAPLQGVDLEIHVAGRRFVQPFSAAANQSTAFVWDGLDQYGRAVQGEQPVFIRLGYRYPAFMNLPPALARSFGFPSGVLVPGDVPARLPVTLSREQRTALGTLGGFDARGFGLGGWSLGVHHLYDPQARVLHQGDGTRRSAQGAMLPAQMRTIAGTGTLGTSGDGGPATLADIEAPVDVAVGRDGAVFILTSGLVSLVRRVDPNGIIMAFAGGGSPPDGVGDGGLATDADLGFTNGLAIGPDDSVYVAAIGRVRRITPNGIISTVAGDGTTGCAAVDPCGDGGPATAAPVEASGIAIAPDGTLIISEANRRRVRRVGPDATILTVAGTGEVPMGPMIGDGGPATAALFERPNDVAVAPDGALLIADQVAQRIRRVGPEGRIATFAGNGSFGFSGDGLPATGAQLAAPQFVAAAVDGSVFLTDTVNHRVRRVTLDGVITTVAGDGNAADATDGEPARAGSLNFPGGIAVAPDGTLVIADLSNHKVRRVSPPPPGVNTTDVFIPSPDGTLLFRFDPAGRHQATQNALTGGVIYQFGYDAAARLVTVTDRDANVTTIQRTAGGAPTAIVGPFGQSTMLTLDANGFLATVTDPAGGVATLTHTASGLLTGFRDARSFEHTYLYDGAGRLTRDDDPAGGFQTLARTVVGTGTEIEVTTAEGRQTTYAVAAVATGGTKETTTTPDGTQATATIAPEGAVARTDADGTVTTATEGPDPRFQMQAPVPVAQSTMTPDGLTATASSTRMVTLTDPVDPLSLTALTDTQTINTKTAMSVYTPASRTFTDTGPEGRVVTTITDDVGRVTRRQATGLAPVLYTYDARGRLVATTHGEAMAARTTTFAYAPTGSLASVTDPLARVVTFEYDLAGRLTRKLLPGSRQIDYTYDASGNLTSITPPNRPAHAFTYTPVDLQAAYTPPDLGPGSEATTYAYNLDRQLETTTRPGGSAIGYGYDTAGRLTSATLARGIVTYAYDAAGRLDTVAAPGGIGLAYDYDGALLTKATSTGPVAGMVTRTHDNDFRTTAIGVNGTDVVYAYDDDGLLTAAGALAITRNAQHGLVTGTVAGMVSDTRTYDAFADLATYSASFGMTALYSYALTRDALGRVTTKTETIGGTTTAYAYVYDAPGRLAEVQQDTVTVATYTYDANGNRTARTGPARTATYDAHDRLLTYGATTYGHAPNGERSTRTVGLDTTTFDYDELGNLLAIDLPGAGGLVEYLIDGNNRRIGRKVDGVLGQGFLYHNGVSPAAEFDGMGGLTARFVFGLRANVPELILKGADTFRVLTDERGSPRLVVNVTTGVIAQRLDYDEFGQVTMDTSPGFQPFGFGGGLYDVATNLVRFGARDYDAEVGRFTAKDLALFGGGDTNLYVYATGDPVNASDPTGTAAVAFIDFPTGSARRSTEGVTLTGPAPVALGRAVRRDPGELSQMTNGPIPVALGTAVRTTAGTELSLGPQFIPAAVGTATRTNDAATLTLPGPLPAVLGRALRRQQDAAETLALPEIELQVLGPPDGGAISIEDRSLLDRTQLDPAPFIDAELAHADLNPDFAQGRRTKALGQGILGKACRVPVLELSR